MVHELRTEHVNPIGGGPHSPSDEEDHPTPLRSGGGPSHVAVAVGLEPTEELPPHTLSSCERVGFAMF